MTNRNRTLCILLAVFALLAVLALPAFAEEAITPDMTLLQLREDPRVQASGIWTYQKANDDPEPKAAETTLRDYVGASMADDCAKMMNALLDRYEAGRRPIRSTPRKRSPRSPPGTMWNCTICPPERRAVSTSS